VQSVLEDITVLMMELLCRSHAMVKAQVSGSQGHRQEQPTLQMMVTSDRETALAMVQQRGKALLLLAENLGKGHGTGKFFSKDCLKRLATIEISMG
jgi:hypothetical protein